MRKKWGIVCIGLGLLLILGAVALWLFNQYEDSKAGSMAQSNLVIMQQAIVQPEVSSSLQQSESSLENTETTIIQVDGNDYIGYLSIPSLDLELPVLSSWSYEKLKLAPCQQFGAVTTANLVIAGHNYSSHFGTLNQLISGDTVFFTDANGDLYSYTVDIVETISATDIEAVEQSGYDLVLYTCTVGGTSRVAVFCTQQTG